MTALDSPAADFTQTSPRVEPFPFGHAVSHKYGTMEFMRTTVDIPDALYRELKSKAAREKRSVKELILRGVEVELRPRFKKRSRRVIFPLVPSKKPGTLVIDNAKIYELISFP